jgi:hypothetical protein
LLTAPAATRTRPSRSFARSCITTVSALAGITPPVKMRTVSRGPSDPVNGLPANDSPTRVSSVSPLPLKSANRTAQPSIAELSWPGTAIGDVRSSASTRSSAWRTWTRSVAVTGVRTCRISARARSTGIESGS